MRDLIWITVCAVLLGSTATRTQELASIFNIGDEGELLRRFSRVDPPTASPLDKAVITGDQKPPNGETSIMFPDIFPIYNNPFFSPGFASIGSIDFSVGDALPWWRGPNVCADRVEKESPDGEEEDEQKAAAEFKARQGIFDKFHFSVNSCVEKPHKYTCTKCFVHNGMKKTVIVTRQCCQGYGRLPSARITETCQKIDIKSFDEAAEDFDGTEFMRSLRENRLEEVFETNSTIFLPNNDAFTKFSEQMFENNLVYIPTGNARRRRVADQFGYTSKDLLKHHIVDGLIRLDDVSNEDVLQTKLENNTIRINIYSRHLVGKNTLYTANCAPLDKVDQVVTGGIIHTVTKVLPPVVGNAMDIIRRRDDMAVFNTILMKTQLNKLLEGDKPITVFAPTDRAFEKLDANLKRKLKEGKSCAANILKNHILDFTLCSKAIFGKPKPMAYNILGLSLNFDRSYDKKASSLATEDILINGLARTKELDIMATNGVVHIVDSILPSSSARAMTVLMQDKNLTIFNGLIEAAGLENEFNDYDNATIFAPVDKAFEDSEWAKMLSEDSNKLKNNEELKAYLRGHVIQPKIKTCDLKEEVMPSLTDTPLRINLYSTHSIFTNVMNRATVNCARLVHFDDESCGTVLHQVEKQLQTPKQNLLQILETTPKYSKFLDAVRVANLTDLLKDPAGGYTILLPKNDIFSEFNLDVTSTKADAERFVKTHVVDDIVCCAGIVPVSWPFIRYVEPLSGALLRANRDRRPRIENAIITKCDIMGTNGIIHELNDVIVIDSQKDSLFIDRPKFDFLTVI